MFSANYAVERCLSVGLSHAGIVSKRLYTVSQKTGPFSFEHNFGKYCLILIILSLLQTEINCDEVCAKFQTSNLLVHYTS